METGGDIKTRHTHPVLLAVVVVVLLVVVVLGVSVVVAAGGGAFQHSRHGAATASRWRPPTVHVSPATTAAVALAHGAAAHGAAAHGAAAHGAAAHGAVAHGAVAQGVGGGVERGVDLRSTRALSIDTAAVAAQLVGTGWLMQLTALKRSNGTPGVAVVRTTSADTQPATVLWEWLQTAPNGVLCGADEAAQDAWVAAHAPSWPPGNEAAWAATATQIATDADGHLALWLTMWGLVIAPSDLPARAAAARPRPASLRSVRSIGAAGKETEEVMWCSARGVSIPGPLDGWTVAGPFREEAAFTTPARWSMDASTGTTHASLEFLATGDLVARVHDSIVWSASTDTRSTIGVSTAKLSGCVVDATAAAASEAGAATLTYVVVAGHPELGASTLAVRADGTLWLALAPASVLASAAAAHAGGVRAVPAFASSAPAAVSPARGDINTTANAAWRAALAELRAQAAAIPNASPPTVILAAYGDLVLTWDTLDGELLLDAGGVRVWSSAAGRCTPQSVLLWPRPASAAPALSPVPPPLTPVPVSIALSAGIAVIWQLATANGAAVSLTWPGGDLIVTNQEGRDTFRASDDPRVDGGVFSWLLSGVSVGNADQGTRVGTQLTLDDAGIVRFWWFDVVDPTVTWVQSLLSDGADLHFVRRLLWSSDSNENVSQQDVEGYRVLAASAARAVQETTLALSAPAAQARAAFRTIAQSKTSGTSPAPEFDPVTGFRHNVPIRLALVNDLWRGDLAIVAGNVASELPVFAERERDILWSLGAGVLRCVSGGALRWPLPAPQPAFPGSPLYSTPVSERPIVTGFGGDMVLGTTPSGRASLVWSGSTGDLRSVLTDGKVVWRASGDVQHTDAGHAQLCDAPP